MDPMELLNFNELTLTDDQKISAAAVFSAIILAIGLFARFYFAHDVKKMSWILSLVNSFVLTVLGATYVLVKTSTMEENFFALGANGKQTFHSIDNVSFLICLWFALLNIFDLVLGMLFYRKYLDPLTAWVHHSVYIWILLASTGHGIFATFEVFSSGLCFNLVEELPTFLLALGSVFPSMRTDVGFGTTFLGLRILYHAYLWYYSSTLGVNLVIPVLYTLTMTLHMFWFSTWVGKYGKRLMGGTSEKRQKSAKSD
jgi:hypothetical protein